MSQQTDGMRKTFTAGEALEPFRRVKISSAATSPKTASYADAADQAVAFTEAYVANGDNFAAKLVNGQGTVKAEATGAITGGNTVYAAADGKVASSGTVVVGQALETVTTAGDIVEVLPIHNSDIATAIVGTTAAAFEVDTDSSTPKIKLASQAAGTGDYTTTMVPESTLSADNEITVPEADGDTLAAIALAQTLTNKTLGLGTRFTVDTVAAAGSAQGDAGALTADAINIVTGADGTKGVKLPTAVAGSFVIVYNPTATNALPVYPGTSDDINDGTTNAAVDTEGKTLSIFFAVDATTWGAIYTADS